MAWETLEPKKKTEDGWEILDKSSAPGRTSLWEDVKIGAANAGGTLDTAVSMLAGGTASLFGQEDDRDDIFANLDKRLKKYQELANPDKKEQGVMGKVAGNVATLPLQVLTFPLSPFSTGKTAIDSGESLSTAQKAIGIDSVGNYIGAALPVSKGLTVGKKILSGGVMNAAQDVGTKKALQSIMDTEAGKKAFDPTREDALVAGIVGAGVGAVFRNNDQRAKVERDKFAKLQEQQAAKAAEAAKQAPVVTPDGNSRAIDDIVNSQIGGWNEPMRQRVDPMDLVKDQLEKQNRSDAGANADAILARRQQEMEDQVARQTSLDFNAAERARRENASTGYAEWLAAREREGLLENPRAQYPNRGEALPYNPEGIPDPTLGEAPRQYDGVDARGFMADEMARPLEQQMQKTQDLDAAWAQHQEQQAVAQKAQAAKDQAEAQAAPMLADLEQSLRDSAYRPTGDGQGPKTRAAKASMNRGVKRGQGGGVDFDMLPALFRKFTSAWHEAGGNFSHVGVSNMLDDNPVQLDPITRKTLESLYPETAKTYQAKIDRAWEQGDPDKAARWGKRYDDALITEAVLKQFDAFGKGFKLDGQSYNAKTGHLANRVKAREDAEAAVNVARRRGGKQSGAIDFDLLTGTLFDLKRGRTKDNSRVLKGKPLDIFVGRKGIENVAQKTRAAKAALNRGPSRGQRGAVLFASRAGKDVDLAKKLTKQKFSPATIFKMTGVYRDVDGKYKTILSDNNSTLDDYALVRKTGKVSDFLHHPELYKLYPKLANIYVQRDSYEKGGRFVDLDGKAQAIIVGESLDASDLKRVLLHEIQHAIQASDKFNLGGSADDFMFKYNLPYEKAFEQYHALHGEQEARFTENWSDLTQNQLSDKTLQLLQEGKTPSHSKDKDVVTRLEPRFGKTQRRGGKQSGALDMSLLDPLFAKTKALAKAVGDLGDYIPKDPDVEALLPQIRGEADIAFSTSKNLESGGTSAAMNRRSSAIMLGARIVQNAQKRADLAVKRFVFPVEDTFRSLNKEEIKTVMDVVKAEVFAQQKFDMADLESTLSVKQLAAYNSFRKMNEDTLRVQNEARTAAGKKPITELEYYAASSWQGVFKQPVRDSQGNLVWYLAGDTQRAINKQWEALKKEFPDLVLKPEEMHRSDQNHGKSKLEKAYTTMIDILDRDDPAVQAIKEAYEKLQAEQTANTLGQQKHFKTKTGVRGFVGDRPGFDKTKEAVNYIQSQIQYSKNALMWAEMQKAGENFSKLVSDPELNLNQPKNVAYLKDYWKTNLGFGESKVFQSIDEAMRSAGVSPAAFAKAVGNTKAFFIMQKLALSPGYIASNFIQTLSILPHMVDMYSKGYKGNPIKAMAVGTPVGLVTAAQHWFGASGEKQALLATMLPGDSRFYTEAIKYAEDNGVVSRSSYDESPISTSLSTTARVGNFIGKASMSYPESVIRSITFMTAAQQLRDSGKFKNNVDLFQRAEEMVNVAMVDYRQGERPMLFAKAGTFGNALNTLQTFPASFYNQWRYFGKEALQGNPAPFLTAFALQMTLAGAMGIPGVADADKLWQFVKSKLPASVWAKVKNNEFLSDPKLWALKYMGEPAVYGALSDYSGVAMTSRMSAPSFADMAASPVGPISDIAGQVGSAASLAMDPMNPTKQAQAAMNSSPVGMQGLVEQKMFPEETGVEMQNGKRGVFNSRKLNDRENVYSRTPEEQTIRNFGLRSQRETAVKESLYRSKYNKQISTEKAGDVADNFYQAIRKGDAKKATEMGKLYVDLSGQPLKNSQIVARLKKEYVDALDRQAMGIKTVEDVRRYKMLQDVLNEID